MKTFVDLFHQIDQTAKTTEKVEALTSYLSSASDEDKVWTIALFTGKHPKRIATSTQLKLWAAELAQIPYWLIEESHHIVGDLSETIANVLPDYPNPSNRSLSEWMLALTAVKKQDEERRKAFLIEAWTSFTKHERFVFNKLTSGAFRMGVSQQLVVKAITRHSGIPENTITHRLMGNWSPIDTNYHSLIVASNPLDAISKPYPFCLAYGLETPLETLGTTNEWQAEYKWDGIRAQLILRNKEVFIWSRGEELITAQYPEFANLPNNLPNGTVIDGELLVYKDDRPLPFAAMQKRIGLKKVTAKNLAQSPIVLMAYDLLEYNGEDIREQPLQTRRLLLQKLIEAAHESSSDIPLHLSQAIAFDYWDQLVQERSNAPTIGSEGLMLKRLSSIYETGRKKGNWWKWKVDPMTVDAVLIYAQSGSGRRANLYTDYTFAVWNEEGALVPFAKAYSGLTDAEIKEVDQWIKKNTIDKFGPVRSVKAELVFEIAFEAIQESKRHKSGIAVRFPRILRWRKDKPASEADTLENLRKSIQQ
ncbi:MAG: ATP-dependent DNA ligase [Bacteroidia bacterium]|jgi:DNA ligase-1|nr:ATP-dependent DNA ligase [Bacteroidia bacterium]